jgi:hypothetical protein
VAHGTALENDPEKGVRFSGKIMPDNKTIESNSTQPDRTLEHDAEKREAFSDGIMFSLIRIDRQGSPIRHSGAR